MKNSYKIDVNRFFDIRNPYALYVKSPGLWKKWEHVASFHTKEEAIEAHTLLVDLPVAL